ncbi:MAG: DUF167 domain-containing protein [Rhodobacteraceae bacterium]|nr:DUF167 domain-containing protein [Paracoccaceae bacterium]
MSNPWQTTDDGLLLTVRLTPKGGRDRLEGVVEDADGRPAIKARVSAPPVDGAANVALIKLLAKTLGVSKSKIRFASGETARIKRLHVIGDTAELANTLHGILD